METCRRCGHPIAPEAFRFGSQETGWEHMPESDCVSSADLHEPGVLCVECSHPDNVETQNRIFHPANRPCASRTEKEVAE